MGTEGLKAVYNLSNRNKRTVMSPLFLSAGLFLLRAGAAYVSPFIGQIWTILRMAWPYGRDAGGI